MACGFGTGGVSPETLNGSESIRPSVTDEKNKSPYVASRALREAVPLGSFSCLGCAQDQK